MKRKITISFDLDLEDYFERGHPDVPIEDLIQDMFDGITGWPWQFITPDKPPQPKPEIRIEPSFAR